MEPRRRVLGYMAKRRVSRFVGKNGKAVFEGCWDEEILLNADFEPGAPLRRTGPDVVDILRWVKGNCQECLL